MAWRLWAKLCCGQKWLLLLFPVFLLFVAITVMTVTLPLPLSPSDIVRRSSRALSSTGKFQSRPIQVMEHSPNVALPLTHIHRGAQRAWEETSKHSAGPKPFKDAAANDRNSIKERSHTDVCINKHKNKGIASKRKEMEARHQRPNLRGFTVNNKGPKHRMKPDNHSAGQAYIQTHLERRKSAAAHIAAPVYTPVSDRKEDGRTNKKPDTQIHDSRTSVKLTEHHKASEKYGQHPGKSDRISKEQHSGKNFRDLKKHHNHSEDPSEAGKNPGSVDQKKALSKTYPVLKTDESSWCLNFTEQDFSDSDHRRIRISPDLWPLPWLSEDDIQKMVFLAGGEVVSKAKVPAHGQVLQVVLDPPANLQTSLKSYSPQHGTFNRHPESHSERCQKGHCSLIKRTDDWFEVFAFHLDRVLGLNRSLPTVLRTFQSEILPYRYISGTPRPVVWWDPDIQHLANKDNDQNSVPLSWVQYQKLLQAQCGRETDLRSEPCVGIHHSEWGKLALFDFILQVNDRLDRYCCGFTPDSTELCVENLLHAKCGNTKDLLLVHILVRKADPSRLVFIDNAGRPQQTSDNLNFRLVEGIDEFPERAVSVFQSGCLESLLLRSLYTDKEFWDSRGGASGLRQLIHTVEHRGQILLQHIRNKKLQLKRDL